MHVLCDLCKEPLCWPPDDHGSDGRDTRFFDNIATAETAAVAAGWQPVNPHDDHINQALRCTACVNRGRAMHAWIKQNRMHDEQV